MRKIFILILVLAFSIAGWANEAEKLFKAVNQKDIKKLSTLLAKEANVNIRNINGQWILHVAISTAKTDICRALIEKGADVNSQNSLGFTPLHILSLNNKKQNKATVEIAQMLIEKGADVNLKNYFSVSPLQWAVIMGQAEIVRLLVEKGADINARESKRGNTALHFAAEKGNREIIHILTSHGGKLSDTNKQGKSALELIRRDRLEAIFAKKKAKVAETKASEKKTIK